MCSLKTGGLLEEGINLNPKTTGFLFIYKVFQFTCRIRLFCQFHPEIDSYLNHYSLMIGNLT